MGIGGYARSAAGSGRKTDVTLFPHGNITDVSVQKIVIIPEREGWIQSVPTPRKPLDFEGLSSLKKKAPEAG